MLSYWFKFRDFLLLDWLPYTVFTQHLFSIEVASDSKKLIELFCIDPIPLPRARCYTRSILRMTIAGLKFTVFLRKISLNKACMCIYVRVVTFGLVSLFNSTSNIIGYSRPKPSFLKNSSGTI